MPSLVRSPLAPITLLILSVTTGPAALQGTPAPSAEAVAAELLAADRAFAAASARTELVAGLSAMFTDDVSMPYQPAEGKAAVVAALRANPANAGARAEWTPIRAGVSADGQHGFTLGYQTVHRADGSKSLAKYVAYWIRKPEGWRVAVYKRVPRPEGEVSLEVLPPALPARTAAPTSDPAVLEAHRASLDAAERQFSTEAQTIGLRAAFTKYAGPNAVNVGRTPAFLVGAEAIGLSFPVDSTSPGSPLTWWPDRVIVASSGDLGVTIGTIKRNTPPAAGSNERDTVPFFTIWHRASPRDPWRYVAE